MGKLIFKTSDVRFVAYMQYIGKKYSDIIVAPSQKVYFLFENLNFGNVCGIYDAYKLKEIEISDVEKYEKIKDKLFDQKNDILRKKMEKGNKK